MNITPISTNFNGNFHIKRKKNKAPITTIEKDDFNKNNKKKNKRKNRLKLFLTGIIGAIGSFLAISLIKNKNQNKNNEITKNGSNKQIITKVPTSQESVLDTEKDFQEMPISEDKTTPQGHLSDEDFEEKLKGVLDDFSVPSSDREDKDFEEKLKGVLSDLSVAPDDSEDENFEETLETLFSNTDSLLNDRIDTEEEMELATISNKDIDKSEAESILEKSKEIKTKASAILEKSRDQKRRVFSEINMLEDKIQQKAKKFSLFKRHEQDDRSFIKDEGYYLSLNELDDEGAIIRRTSFNPATSEIISIEKFKDGRLYEQINIDNSSTMFEDTVTLLTGINSSSRYQTKSIQDSYTWKNKKLSVYESNTDMTNPESSTTEEIYEFSSDEELTRYSSDISGNVSTSNVGITYNFQDLKLVSYVENSTKCITGERTFERKITF